MYGIVTRNTEELTWPTFERGFYELKDVTGRVTDASREGVNMISCFGDTAAGESNPSLVPVSQTGARATRASRYFDWGYVCPNRLDYRDRLLELIEETVAINPDLRLDDIGFPRAEYCHCEACEEAFRASNYHDRAKWRQAVITDFIGEVAQRVPGDLFVTIYPDPYPGHLERRTGVDVDAIASHVDEFVVPIYDTAYGTTYWLEILAQGFESRLETPFGVELYAVDVDIDALTQAVEVADAVADHVYFGYDSGTAQATIRRRRAESVEGKDYPSSGGQSSE